MKHWNLKFIVKGWRVKTLPLADIGRNTQRKMSAPISINKPIVKMSLSWHLLLSLEIKTKPTITCTDEKLAFNSQKSKYWHFWKQWNHFIVKYKTPAQLKPHCAFPYQHNLTNPSPCNLSFWFSCAVNHHTIMTMGFLA